MTTVFDYIAENNPDGVETLFDKHGYATSSNDTATLSAGLEQLVMTEGDDALVDMCLIHPDRDMILGACGRGNTGSVVKDRNGIGFLNSKDRDTKIIMYAILGVIGVYIIAKAAK